MVSLLNFLVHIWLELLVWNNRTNWTFCICNSFKVNVVIIWIYNLQIGEKTVCIQSIIAIEIEHRKKKFQTWNAFLYLVFTFGSIAVIAGTMPYLASLPLRPSERPGSATADSFGKISCWKEGCGKWFSRQQRPSVLSLTNRPRV